MNGPYQITLYSIRIGKDELIYDRTSKVVGDNPRCHQCCVSVTTFSRVSLSVLLFAISLAFVTLGKILLKYYTGESSYSVT